MSEVQTKVEELRTEMKILKTLVKEKVDTTDGYEQMFWINFLIEVNDMDYRLYDMEQTIPKYEE